MSETNQFIWWIYSSHYFRYEKSSPERRALRVLPGGANAYRA